MGRIRLPQRPNPSRVQAARVAAARVATASVQQAVTEEIAAIELGIPADLSGTISTLNNELVNIRDRLDELEGP